MIFQEHLTFYCLSSFADDTTEGQNYNNLILTLNTELNKLVLWLQTNKLTLNTDKTHYMVFHRARIKSKTWKISIRNNAIDDTLFIYCKLLLISYYTLIF